MKFVQFVRVPSDDPIFVMAHVYVGDNNNAILVNGITKPIVSGLSIIKTNEGLRNSRLYIDKRE